MPSNHDAGHEHAHMHGEHGHAHLRDDVPHSHGALGTTRRKIFGFAGLAALVVGAAPAIARTVPPVQERGPWLGKDVPPAFQSSRQMKLAARSFLAGLTNSQRSTCQYAQLGDAARTKWSNFPAGMSPRAGIAVGDLTDAQRVRMHDLLAVSTSSQGYHKMTGAMRADDTLHDLHGEPLFGAQFYYVSLFGSPDANDWAWMLTGHHMSAIFTVSGDRTAFTPMFTGAQPLQIASGVHAGWRVLPNDARRAGDLLASLSAAQQRIAIIGKTSPGDVVAGSGRQKSLAGFAGIAAGELGDGQQRLLWQLIGEFVGNANPEAADAQLTLIRKSWRDTHFAWQGQPPETKTPYYFRVHGPRILIEYDVQEPLTSEGGHVHAITRDALNDYGMDWLGRHYKETDHRPGGSGGPPAECT